MKLKKSFDTGFTLVEIAIVVFIIGILATITYISYNGIQKRVVDMSVESDVARMASLQLNYKSNHGVSGVVYSSLSNNDNGLGFTPKSGNIIDVFINSTDYCVRGYNTSGTKNSSDNAVLKESSSGACVAIGVVNPPVSAPEVVVTLNAGSILATITPVTCNNGTVQYSIDSRTNDGSWAGYTAWSDSVLTATRSSSEGVKYGYRAQARCYISDASHSIGLVGSESSYTSVVNAPSVPNVAVALSGSNILATASAAACTAGTVQYGFNNRTNDGAWAGYTDWSASTTSSQSASEGFKYGYRAQARCYVSDSVNSGASISSEGTYTNPITSVPDAPAVSNSTPDSYNTNYSWSAPNCPTNATATYQYYFSTGYGYNSGWVSTSGTSVSFTTVTGDYNYVLQVQAKCYSAYSTSGWGGTGSSTYYRPILVQVLVVAGGGGGGAGDSYGNGGGGGAGGYISNTSYQIYRQGYWVGVGGGGGGAGSANAGNNGGNSTFNSLTAIGGGGGGGGNNNINGFTGGSGGGGSGSASNGRPGSNGTDGQGNKGGGSSTAAARGAGGGGGAGDVGGCGSCHTGSVAGNGGTGIWNGITGTGICYAGGGGGGIGSGTEGSGSCGGGNAHETQGGESASANTGSGGGGGKGSGGNGGSGIVIIRYLGSSISAGGGNSGYWNGSDVVQIFYGSGTFQVY